MSKAQDYVFEISAFGNIYLAKKNKSNKVMSEDRRIVEDDEIIGMFEHYLRRRCKEVGNNGIVISADGKKIFEAKLLDWKKEDKNED